MKYVLVVLVIVIVLWWMWGRGERGAPAARSARPEPRGRRDGGEAAPESMVRCAHCGVHLPRSDALPAPDGAVYCCAPHRAAGARRQDDA